MKLFHEWDAKDVEVGTRVKPESGNEMIIGYLNTARTKRRYVLIDPRDGMVTKPETKAMLATWLSQYNCAPVPR